MLTVQIILSRSIIVYNIIHNSPSICAPLCLQMAVTGALAHPNIVTTHQCHIRPLLTANPSVALSTPDQSVDKERNISLVAPKCTAALSPVIYPPSKDYPGNNAISGNRSGSSLTSHSLNSTYCTPPLNHMAHEDEWQLLVHSQSDLSSCNKCNNSRVTNGCCCKIIQNPVQARNEVNAINCNKALTSAVSLETTG